MSRTYKRSPETIAKMSAAQTGRKHSPDLAGLDSDQYRVYQTLRRKGCSHDEAPQEARRPLRTVPEAAQ